MVHTTPKGQVGRGSIGALVANPRQNIKTDKYIGVKNTSTQIWKAVGFCRGSHSVRSSVSPESDDPTLVTPVLLISLSWRTVQTDSPADSDFGIVIVARVQPSTVEVESNTFSSFEALLPIGVSRQTVPYTYIIPTAYTQKTPTVEC